MGLKIENLTKTYGDFKALNHVSLEAENGKILGILGRNGAGKTTTIKSIMGIIEPEEGSITFDGIDIRKAKVSIGYLPEERGLYVNAVVKDQLLYFAMLNGMDKKVAFTEIKKLLEEFKIPGYLNKKVKTLSKGNKQKIQLISAILHKPQIVILDEPFSGLDPVNIELFKSTVLDLKKSGATILFSSHRMEDVEEMCDRIVMLNKGNVVENNTVQGLINKYSREDVMNIVTSADITELIAESGLKLESRENMSFDVQFNDRNKLQHLYARILESGIELQGIRSRKTSLQEIFIKELADNE
uniref:ABC transporter ATP-binding protein n=1 Tax=Agathobacter sp. TaxID=2021311 RepID=UPI003FF0EE21